MKAAEAHSMSDIDLIEKLKNAREESFGLRLRHATGELEDPAALNRVRKDIARLLTIAKQRKIDVERESSQK